MFGVVSSSSSRSTQFKLPASCITQPHRLSGRGVVAASPGDTGGFLAVLDVATESLALFDVASKMLLSRVPAPEGSLIQHAASLVWIGKGLVLCPLRTKGLVVFSTGFVDGGADDDNDDDDLDDDDYDSVGGTQSRLISGSCESAMDVSVSGSGQPSALIVAAGGLRCLEFDKEGTARDVAVCKKAGGTTLAGYSIQDASEASFRWFVGAPETVSIGTYHVKERTLRLERSVLLGYRTHQLSAAVSSSGDEVFLFFKAPTQTKSPQIRLLQSVDTDGQDTTAEAAAIDLSVPDSGDILAPWNAVTGGQHSDIAAVTSLVKLDLEGELQAICYNARDGSVHHTTAIANVEPPRGLDRVMCAPVKTSESRSSVCVVMGTDIVVFSTSGGGVSATHRGSVEESDRSILGIVSTNCEGPTVEVITGKEHRKETTAKPQEPEGGAAPVFFHTDSQGSEFRDIAINEVALHEIREADGDGDPAPGGLGPQLTRAEVMGIVDEVVSKRMADLQVAMQDAIAQSEKRILAALQDRQP